MSNSLKVACSIENLKTIRTFLEKALAGKGLPEEEINLMVLAVDEICANLIIHSNLRDPKKEIEVAFFATSEGFVFEIMDSGKAFDPESISEPSIPSMVKEKKKGGLGLMLVRKIMDSIELKTENTFTTYRLFKRISAC